MQHLSNTEPAHVSRAFLMSAQLTENTQYQRCKLYARINPVTLAKQNGIGVTTTHNLQKIHNISDVSCMRELTP
jgi:hypothetical protein